MFVFRRTSSSVADHFTSEDKVCDSLNQIISGKLLSAMILGNQTMATFEMELKRLKSLLVNDAHTVEFHVLTQLCPSLWMITHVH
jgi:hypothetical protein